MANKSLSSFWNPNIFPIVGEPPEVEHIGVITAGAVATNIKHIPGSPVINTGFQPTNHQNGLPAKGVKKLSEGGYR